MFKFENFENGYYQWQLDLINVLEISYLTELNNDNSMSVFCGIIKVTFIELSYHGEHKESIIKSKSTPIPETPTAPCPHKNDSHEAATEEILNSNMKSTNERLDKLSTEMAELTKNLEHTQDQLDDQLKTIKTDITNLDSAVKEIEHKFEEFKQNLKKSKRS